MNSQQNNPPANDFLSEIIIGMSDGLIVPFALTTGLTRVSGSDTTIVTAGMVAITAGALAMGLGGYLTGRSESNLYQADTDTKQKQPPKEEEAKAFFANLGLSEEMQVRAAEELVKDKKQFDELLGHDQLQKTLPGGPVRSGLTIGLSYAVGGMITISPYLLIDHTGDALKVAAICTLSCLLVLGFFKSRITGINPLWGAIRTGLVGALAATGAYIVANLFVQ